MIITQIPFMLVRMDASRTVAAGKNWIYFSEGVVTYFFYTGLHKIGKKPAFMTVFCILNRLLTIIAALIAGRLKISSTSSTSWHIELTDSCFLG
jgi:hypothetical protein